MKELKVHFDASYLIRSMISWVGSYQLGFSLWQLRIDDVELFIVIPEPGMTMTFVKKVKKVRKVKKVNLTFDFFAFIKSQFDF